jgi:hypothetical protein
MKIIKAIATLLNTAILIAFFYASLSKGFPFPSDWVDVLMMSLVLIVPTINIFAIWGEAKDDSWFQLFLKRKALEEKKKIEKLKINDTDK